MPDYQTVTGEEPLLNWIENSLDRPVTLASRGLTWQHKHMRQNRYRRSTTTSPSTSFCASVRSAVRSSETSV